MSATAGDFVGRYFFDEDGIPRAVFGRGFEPLGGLLFDLHNTRQPFDEVLHAVDDVQAGRATDWGWGGNDHTVTVTTAGALIECEFSIPPGKLLVPLTDFRRAVVRWQAFLAGRPR